MDALLLYPRTTLGHGATAFDWWRSAAEAHGYRLEIAFFDEVATEVRSDGVLGLRLRGRETATPRLAIVRGYDYGLSRHLQMMGAEVVNDPTAMMMSHDKMMTHRLLATAGIATPATFEVSTATAYAEAAAMVGGERFVVKRADGSRGEGVSLVGNSEQYLKAAASVQGEKMLVQRYVATSHGRDIRVWIIGGKVAGSVLRRSATSFLSNYSQGGSAELIALPPEAAAPAEAAANALGLYFAGVDILFDGAGYTVCEVNGNAGFRSLSACGGPDIINIFFNRLHDCD